MSHLGILFVALVSRSLTPSLGVSAGQYSHPVFEYTPLWGQDVLKYTVLIRDDFILLTQDGRDLSKVVDGL